MKMTMVPGVIGALRAVSEGFETFTENWCEYKVGGNPENSFVRNSMYHKESFVIERIW